MKGSFDFIYKCNQGNVRFIIESLKLDEAVNK